MAIDCVSGHTAYIYDRGAQQRLFQVRDISEVQWERVRDDIGEASIDIAAKYCFQQERLLDMIEPGRHELVLYRGNERSWEGPITRESITRDRFSVYARDVMHYASRAAMESGYSNAYPNVDFAINRVRNILEGELPRLEAATTDRPGINVLPHVVYHQTPTDARTSRVTLPMEQYVWEQIDSLAAKGGIDYTVIGRAIHLWDTSKALGQTRTLTENDFLGDIIVTVYGMDLATRGIVTDGQGNYGIAGGEDPYYGLVDHLTTAYDETEGATPPTSAEMESQAQRNISGKNPAPLFIRIPDNSTLNPAGILSINDLVPGVHMPLRAKLLVKTIEQMQRLDRMRVTENAAGEEITVTLFPAAKPDEPEPEE